MKKNLLLFVHGIGGSKDTWKNKDTGKFFGELLLDNLKIEENFDVEYFVYGSSFLKKIKMFQLLKGIASKTKTIANKSIKDFSEELRTKIKVNYENYESIIIIAHSMGGLITKDVILKNPENIKIFISLATPYNGSKITNLFKPLEIIKSKIINEMKPLEEMTDSLTRKWLDKKVEMETHYICGNNDLVVEAESSYSYEARIKDKDYFLYTTNDDHTTISKPKKDNQVYKIVEKIILNFIEKKNTSKKLIEKFKDNHQYDEMSFVIKMILAKVGQKTQDISKYSFFKYELFIRSLSEKDIKLLNSLEKKILELYDDKYARFENNDLKNSTDLILTIKEELKDKDNTYYSFSNKLMEHCHKFGCLHNLSNENDNIIWTKEVKND